MAGQGGEHLSIHIKQQPQRQKQPGTAILQHGAHHPWLCHMGREPVCGRSVSGAPLPKPWTPPYPSLALRAVCMSAAERAVAGCTFGCTLGCQGGDTETQRTRSVGSMT